MKVTVFVLVVFVCASLYSQTAIQPSGSGTEASPYLIESLENLYWISQNAGTWGGWFRQTADIDASETATWNPDGAGGYYGWSPIGTDAGNFTGRYNGNGFTISKLMINRPETDNIGLFGKVRNPDAADWRQTISNLGLIDVNITGGHKTGALIGYIIGWYSGSSWWPTMHRPLIERCYSTGSVIGNQYSGGLIGLMDKTFIKKSYSTCSVNGGWRVGGFAGAITWYSATWDCYSVGYVDGAMDVGGFTGFINDYVALFYSYSSGYVDNGVNLGGFVGINGGGNATNCYWDTETSGRVNSAVGTPKTTAELLTRGMYGSNWDFESANPTWWMVENQTRPMLTSNRSSRVFAPHQLQLIKSDLSASYTLMQDLDLSCLQNPADVWGTSETSGSGFVPIGDNTNPFTGSLDGNDFTIDNLYINRNSNDYIGLFGCISSSTIENLGLTNVNISGNDYTGGLTGKSESSSGISNSYSTGSVSGTWFLGGLVGFLSGSSSVSYSYSNANVSGSGNRVGGLVGDGSSSSISYSYSAGNVNGQSFVGGFTGYNNSLTISNSYSTGNVGNTGTVIGGFAGYNSSSTISNSYSTGSIDGFGDVGGFVGYNSVTPISNCFWDAETDNLSGTTSGSTNYGATGKTTAEMKNIDTFTNIATVGLTNPWDFTDVWEIYIGFNDGYPYLQWQFSAPIPPAVPQNVIISIAEGDVTITWDAVSGATSYKVYSSAAPDGDFTEELGGTFNGASWSKTENDSKKFYHVKAIKSGI